jgi:hypothetical protein
MTDNARDKRPRCRMLWEIATATLDAPRTRRSERLSRRRNDPEPQPARCQASPGSSRRTYFAAHPSELLESAETVRRGWIVNLPRLRDRLERRCRK